MTKHLLLSALVAVPLLCASPLSAQAVHSLPAADRPLGGMPENLYSIGSLDGEPWEILSRVRGVGFDDVGRLYVLDADSRVLTFGPDGEFLGQFGRKGEGPGEINRPMAMVVAGDGTVVVVDPSAGYQVFGPGGDFRHAIRSRTPMFGMSGIQVVWSADALVAPGGSLASLEAGQQGRGLPVYRQPLDPAADAEVIHDADVPTVQGSVTSGAGGGRRVRMRRPAPYSPSLKLAAGKGTEVAMVTGTDWKLEVLSATGGVVATLKRPLPGRPSTPEDREVLEERMQDGGAQGVVVARRSGGAARSGGPPAGMQGSPGELDIAETIPSIRALRGDGDGVVFVARETNPVDQPAPPIDVVTLDGDYLGSLSGEELPAAFGPDRRAAYVETDDLGIERVVVRRLPAAWFGG